jgi:mRNA interferase MazF
LKRGDLLTVIVPGDFGKPRPAVVIQADRAASLDSVIVCLVTSDLSSPFQFRVALSANEETGLRKPSQIMVDKMFTSYREKCGQVFGRVDAKTLAALNEALTFMTGITELSL